MSLESHTAVVAGPSTSHTEEKNLENREVDEASDVEDEHFNSKMDCGSLVLPRPPIAKDLTTGTNQWVVVKFSTKKSIKHFIGRVRKVMSCDELEVGVLKMTGKDSHVFAWPDPEGVCDIKCDDIVEVLDEPSSPRRGFLKFKEHLHSLM